MKMAIVTGATRGLGEAIASGLVKGSGSSTYPGEIMIT